MSNDSQYPLVVIVGPTASGKTSLGIRIAKQFRGEIIAADSRTIYSELDVGTAKPSVEEREGVPHWGIDLINPSERYSAIDFQHYAKETIADIRLRGRLPILVGGTGLYVDSLLYDYSFAKVDERYRNKLESWTVGKLMEHCKKNNIILPRGEKNKRHIITKILQDGQLVTRKYSPPANTIVVGIATQKKALRKRLRHRAHQMLQDYVVSEALMVANKYGWDCPGLTGNVYPVVRQYCEGSISISEAQNRCEYVDWQLARRQMTWFRRDPYVEWAVCDEVSRYIAQKLANLD